MPSINDPIHAGLESDVIIFLEQNDFIVVTSAYHDVLPDYAVSRLRHLDTIESLFIRVKHDRIAIHNKYPVVIYIECKSKNKTSHNDCLVEALPLAMHINNWKSFMVDTLYCYRHPQFEIDAGFYVSKMPRIGTLVVPDRFLWMESMLTHQFNDVRDIWKCGSTFGSNDPYVKIYYDQVSVMEDWRKLIIDKISLFKSEDI